MTDIILSPYFKLSACNFLTEKQTLDLAIKVVVSLDIFWEGISSMMSTTAYL